METNQRYTLIKKEDGTFLKINRHGRRFVSSLSKATLFTTREAAHANGIERVCVANGVQIDEHSFFLMSPEERKKRRAFLTTMFMGHKYEVKEIEVTYDMKKYDEAIDFLAREIVDRVLGGSHDNRPSDGLYVVAFIYKRAVSRVNSDIMNRYRQLMKR